MKLHDTFPRTALTNPPAKARRENGLRVSGQVSGVWLARIRCLQDDLSAKLREGALPGRLLRVRYNGFSGYGEILGCYSNPLDGRRIHFVTGCNIPVDGGVAG